MELFLHYNWWQNTIFIIGILTVLSVYGALFIASGSGPRRLFANIQVPAVGDPDFLIALSHSVNVALGQGGTVEVLNNGDEFFPSLINAIESAKKNINFSVYIWKKGEVSTQILGSLIKKQKEGVQVRVLLDGLGGRSAPTDLFNELKLVGGKIERYRTPRFGKLTRYHRRNHRRAIIIDGQVGFIGGMAVKDSWLGNAQDPKRWRDMMFKITGPMARSLQDSFVDHWAGSLGEILIGQDIYARSFPADQDTPIQYIHLASSPAEDSQPIPKFILLPILAAKKSLYIVTPYFIANNDLMEALKSKAKSGVDVRLLLPGENIDNKSVRWGAQNYYNDLMEAGVRIYEYQPTFIHSKFFVVDNQLSVIGSLNLNNRSRRLDEENAMAVLDKSLADQLTKNFTDDLVKSKEINLASWKKRNPFIRILQLMSKLLKQQS